tara:strand:- start:161 stop:1366 length:1206 start_codon:yes stop_codon:yes gene_type:complete
MAQVSSYDVANRSGAQVRQDIKDIFEAVKTCNSGPSDPASPEKFMLFGDTTTGDNNLKIYDGSNFRTIGKVDEDNLGLVKRSGDTFTGVLELHNSTGADSPALTFNGNTDTGIFRPSANTIGFSTAASKKVEIDTNGLTIIADTNATRTLTFQEATTNGNNVVSLKSPTSLTGNVALTLPPSITNGGFLQTDGNGQLSFQIVNGVPTGAVFALPDTQGTGTGFQSNGIPTGYLECNGQTLDRTTYAALFNVIGTTYGNTTSSNFKVPDLRGEFIRGWASNTTDSTRDQGRGIGTAQGTSNAFHNHSASSHVNDSGHRHHSFRLQNAGQLQHGSNLTTTNFPASGTGAGHLNECYNITATGATPNVGLTSNVATGITVTTTIGNDGSESRPRNIAMLYIIKI